MVAKPTTRKRATYLDVLDAPEHVVAEVLDGELYLFPRPARRHAENSSSLGAFLKTAFDFGFNGPGGWRIIDEPELHLVDDILVPDIAGWRDGRLVDDPDVDEAYITVVPDWLCEVLSPSTTRVDRMKKMPIYAREGVKNVWLAEPKTRTIEVFRLNDAGYTLIGTFGGEEPVRAEPFAELELEPKWVWGRSAAVPPSAKSKPKKRTRKPKR